MNAGRSKVQASQPAIQMNPDEFSPVVQDKNQRGALSGGEDNHANGTDTLVENNDTRQDIRFDEKRADAELKQMLQSVYGKDDPARGELGIEALNIDNSKERIDGQGQELENQENVQLLGEGLIQDMSRDKDDGNNEPFTDEERAKLNSIINIFAKNKDESQNGKLQKYQFQIYPSLYSN